MEQQQLGHARPTDPETSHTNQIDRSRSQRAVLGVLRVVGPMAHHQLCNLLDGQLSPSRARTAVKELRTHGLVRDSGLRTRTPSGRKAVIWEATTWQT